MIGADIRKVGMRARSWCRDDDISRRLMTISGSADNRERQPRRRCRTPLDRYRPPVSGLHYAGYGGDDFGSANALANGRTSGELRATATPR
jgi:hypothetical protein